MTPVTITLTDDEYQQVVTAAGRRATLHENAGRGNDWTFYRHFLGCASEFALAKYVNGSWTPFADEDSFRKIEHDVVGRQGYQVRATDQRFGNLLLTRHDERGQNRNDRPVHRHRDRHVAQVDAVEQLAHVEDRVDRHTRHADVTGDARVVGIVPAVRGEVEGH